MKQFIITVVDFGQFFYDRLNSCVRGQLEPVPVFVCSFLFLCLYVRDYYFCIIDHEQPLFSIRFPLPLKYISIDEVTASLFLMNST
jgi:hypothetical protein